MDLAQDLRQNGFEIDYKGALIFYAGNEENVIVPDYVLEIGAGAFNGNTDIKKVVLPVGLQKIGDCAFKECENLVEINIPVSVTFIGTEAFSNCLSLKNIFLPGGIKKVEDEMFYNCKSLAEVKFGEGIVEIGHKVFDRNQFSYGTSLEKVILPESLERIGSDAFVHCGKLKNINFPKNLQHIDNGAFYCSGLENVEIPNSSSSIGFSMWAFYGSSDISTIKIGEGAFLIGEGAFQADSCKKVRRIYLPASTGYVEKNAFSSAGHNIIYSPVNAAVIAYCQTAEHSVSWEIDFNNPKSTEGLAEFYLEKNGTTEQERIKIEKNKADIVLFNDAIKECERKVIELNSEINSLTGAFSGLKRNKLIKEQNSKNNEIASLQSKILTIQKEIEQYDRKLKDTIVQLKTLTGEELKNLIDEKIESIQSSIRYHISRGNETKTYVGCNYTLSLDSIDKFRSSLDYILVPRIDVSDM